MLLLTFTLSFISELSRGFAAIPMFAAELMACEWHVCLDWFSFVMLFFLFLFGQYNSNIHACMHVFFLKKC